MARVKSSSVDVAGHSCRVLEAGTGSPVVFFAGIGGLPKWSPFLDALSTTHRVIAPSLPGFPGATEFRHLDDYHEWVVAALELLEALGDTPVDLIASSVTGPLAAEVAGIARDRVRRLVLVAPFGMFDAAEPTADIWAQRPGPDVLPALLCNEPERWTQLWQMPAGRRRRRVGNLPDARDGGGCPVSISDGKHRHFEAALSRTPTDTAGERRRRSSHSGVVPAALCRAPRWACCHSHRSIGRASRGSRPARRTGAADQRVSGRPAILKQRISWHLHPSI